MSSAFTTFGQSISPEHADYNDTNHDGINDYGKGILGAPLPSDADGVATGLSITGSVLTMTRSNGLPPLVQDLSPAVDDAMSSPDQAAVSALMASMASNPDAITVTDAFGMVIYHGLQA